MMVYLFVCVFVYFYIDAVIRPLAGLLKYWSQDVDLYSKGCFVVVKLCKWNESIFLLNSASQLIYHLSNAKMAQKHSTFQLWLPLHLTCCQTAGKLIQEDYFDKAISKDRIQNKNIMVCPVNVK